MMGSKLFLSLFLLVSCCLINISAEIVSFQAGYDDGNILVTEIGYGTPMQRFKMILGITDVVKEDGRFMESGSFILPSKSCKECSSTRKFNETASVTAKWGKPLNNVDCAPGQLIGRVDNDVIHFNRIDAHKNVQAFMVESMDQCPEFNEANFDGVLTFNPTNTVDRSRIVPLALYDNGDIEKAWMTVSEKNLDWTFSFGKIPTPNPIQWYSIGKYSDYWVLSDDIKGSQGHVGSYKFKVDSLTFNAHINTLSGPASAIGQIFDTINAKPLQGNYFQADCDTYHQLPPIVLNINDGKAIIQLQPEDYIINTGKFCVIMITPQPSTSWSGDDWFLGSLGFRRNGITFDFDARKIGFYERGNDEIESFFENEHLKAKKSAF